MFEELHYIVENTFAFASPSLRHLYEAHEKWGHSVSFPILKRPRDFCEFVQSYRLPPLSGMYRYDRQTNRPIQDYSGQKSRKTGQKSKSDYRSVGLCLLVCASVFQFACCSFGELESKLNKLLIWNLAQSIYFFRFCIISVGGRKS